MPLLCHRATGLTRGYWRSTDAPVQTSTVLPRDDVMREANGDVSSVTQVTVIPDRGVAGKRPVSGGPIQDISMTTILIFLAQQSGQKEVVTKIFIS